MLKDLTAVLADFSQNSFQAAELQVCHECTNKSERDFIHGYKISLRLN